MPPKKRPPAPKGFHYMPNGKLMKGDKHPTKKKSVKKSGKKKKSSY